MFETNEKELVPFGEFLNHLVTERTSEFCEKVPIGELYEKARIDISSSMERLKECLTPEQYREIVIKVLDSAIGSIEIAIQEFYYKQGLKDGMELLKILNH